MIGLILEANGTKYKKGNIKMNLAGKQTKVFVFCCLMLCFSPLCLSKNEEVRILLSVLRSKQSVSDPASSFRVADNKLTHEERRMAYETARKEYDIAKQEYEIGVQNAMNRLAAMGDQVVQTLLEEYKKNHLDLDGMGQDQYRNNIIITLGKINTKISQDMLLSMAQGKIGGFGPSQNAAGVYVDNLQTKSDAIPLLDSKQLQSHVLRRLKGAELDQPLYEKCETFLFSQEYYLRERAAHVICSDPNINRAEEKLDILVRSLQTVAEMPYANQKYQSHSLGTNADNIYAELTRAMMNIVGLNSSYIKPHLHDLQGSSRFCLEILLAHEQDASEKDALKRNIQDIYSGTVMRLLALSQFEKILSEGDKSFLILLSQNDPLLIYDLGGPLYEIVDSSFLVSPHSSNNEVIDAEEKAFQVLREQDILQRGSSGRKYYIIRERAKGLLDKHFISKDDNK